MWFLGFGVLLFSTLIAVPFSLYCEVPYMILEKILLTPGGGGGRKKKKLKEDTPNLNIQKEDSAEKLLSQSTDGESSDIAPSPFREGINPNFGSINSDSNYSESEPDEKIEKRKSLA